MEITITREQMLTPLNQIIGAVERKMTFPILANIKVDVLAEEKRLVLTGTDLEVELKSASQLNSEMTENTSVTLPGKKLAEICKSLPEETEMKLKLNGNLMHISANKSKFRLTTLPAEEFPSVLMSEANTKQLQISGNALHNLIQRTHFAMAQQDVRYFLNGMLFDFDGSQLTAVATDGHRLASNAIQLNSETPSEPWKVIIPRKTISELLRLISPDETKLTITLNEQHIGFSSPCFSLTSKLIDGNFPDYRCVIPSDCNKTIAIDRDLLKQALIRTSILSSEKHRSVVFSLNNHSLTITANNPDQEEATESLPIDYEHDALDIAFNVTYLLNILAVVDAGFVELSFKDSESSLLVHEASEESHTLYVIMPMRL